VCFRHHGEIFPHDIQPTATGFGFFDQALDADEKLRQVHLLAELCQVWLNLRVLENTSRYRKALRLTGA